MSICSECLEGCEEIWVADSFVSDCCEATVYSDGDLADAADYAVGELDAKAEREFEVMQEVHNEDS